LAYTQHSRHIRLAVAAAQEPG